MEQRKIEYTTVDIDSIEAHPKNVRQGDIGAISESLKAHGQYRPIVVDRRTNFILAGNHTWKAAKSLGWSKISAGFIETKNENEAVRILLADNRTTDLAMYNDDGLAELLKSLSGSDEGFAGTLYDGDDLDDLIYKLNGSLGFIKDVPDASEQLANFDLTDTRNLVLPFTKQNIEIVKQRLNELMKDLGKQSYSEIVLYLIENYDKNN